MSARWPRPSFYIVLLLAIALDQVTKWWATEALTGSTTPLPLAHFISSASSITLIPGFFNLTYVQNTGIAFGMMKGHGMLVALFVIALALGAIVYARGLNWASWEPNVVGGSLVGGAVGNLLDRTRLGYVVDFFDVHAGIHHWPVFNVADSLICLSVAWIVARQLGIGSKR